MIGNAVLYRNGVPLASLEAGELVHRHALESGARIDADLGYTEPQALPRRDQQTRLPLPAGRPAS